MKYTEALIITAIIAGIVGTYSYAISVEPFWTSMISFGFIVFLIGSKLIQILGTRLGY